MVDSDAEINELLDGVFASEHWSVEHVSDNCAAQQNQTESKPAIIEAELA